MMVPSNHSSLGAQLRRGGGAKQNSLGNHLAEQMVASLIPFEKYQSNFREVMPPIRYGAEDT